MQTFKIDDCTVVVVSQPEYGRMSTKAAVYDQDDEPSLVNIGQVLNYSPRLGENERTAMAAMYLSIWRTVSTAFNYHCAGLALKGELSGPPHCRCGQDLHVCRPRFHMDEWICPQCYSLMRECGS